MKKAYQHQRKIVALLAIILLTIAPICGAQPPDTLWTRTVGGEYNDQGYDVEFTTQGSFIAVGSTSSFSTSDEDGYACELTTQGDTLWTKTYGGENRDVFNSVSLAQDGGFYLAGETESFGAVNRGGYLVKVNSEGVVEWQETYGGSEFNFNCTNSTKTQDGIVLVGSANPFGAVDGFMIKVDNDGDSLWSRLYGFGNLSLDVIRDVNVLTDGSMILCGDTRPPVGDLEAFLIKVDSLGNTIWSETYNVGQFENSAFVKETQDGGLIFGGSQGNPISHAFVVKTDGQGSPIWTWPTEVDDLRDGVSDLIERSDGSFVLCGYNETSNGLFLTILSLSSNGNEGWQLDFGSDVNSYAFSSSLTVDTSNNLMVIGSIGLNGPIYTDFYFVYLDCIESVDPIPIVANEFHLYQNYPNPFNASTTIPFELFKSGDITLRIIDVLGREVLSYHFSSLEKGDHRIRFDSQMLSTGAYYYRLNTPTNHQTKRFVILK